MGLSEDKMRNLFFVGTAGSGKSTLVGAFKTWLEDNGVDSIVINLDPGAETLPYTPNIDIREWISLDEVMSEYGLGPNGAQIVAADLMAVNIRKMMDVVETFKTDYVLIDTPGQLELFAFRESSDRIVTAFGKDKSMLVYLSDPTLCRTPNGFISSMMLSSIVEFRLQLPAINLLSKCDMFKEEETDRMIAWFENSDVLYSDLMDDRRNSESVVGMELLKALDNMGRFGEIRSVSAQEDIGLGDIYSAAQLEFFAGEDTSRE
jgi:GPN-loop GTPase